MWRKLGTLSRRFFVCAFFKIQIQQLLASGICHFIALERLGVMRMSRKPIESDLLGKVRRLDGRDQDSRNAKPKEPETWPYWTWFRWMNCIKYKSSFRENYCSEVFWAETSHEQFVRFERLCITHQLIEIDFSRCWEKSLPCRNLSVCLSLQEIRIQRDSSSAKYNIWP